MLQPTRTKYRKAHKGRIHGRASRGTLLNYGTYGLRAMEPERIISNVGDKFFYKSNFDDVISLFDKLERKTKIFFVAGDIGVIKQKTLIFCEKKDNLYFIATGMGNKRLDNYLEILISSEGKILSIQPILY